MELTLEEGVGPLLVPFSEGVRDEVQQEDPLTREAEATLSCSVALEALSRAGAEILVDFWCRLFEMRLVDAATEGRRG